MYATVNHMRFTSPVEQMVDVLREGAEILGTYPGFKSIQIVQEGSDGVVFIVLWQTQQEAESAAYSFGPGWFGQTIGPRLYGPQRPSAGEVLASA